MPSLTGLPSELQARIVHFVDRQSLKGLRRTCRQLSHFTTNELFRDVVVGPNDESCARLERILEDRTLRAIVKKVYLDTSDWNYDLEGDDHDIDDEEERVLPRRFQELVLRLKDFPNLRSAVLRFDKDCYVDNDWVDYPQDVKFRSAVTKLVFSSLISLPLLPQELALQNIQNINETDVKTTAMIARVLQNLTSLRLNIVNEHDEGNGEHDLERSEPHTFFSQLPSTWLKPTTSNLQHLTLYSTLYFGFYPKLDLGGIHFPHLKTLAFGNHGFVHDSQLDWILSHGSTLRELYLDDSPILYEVAIYEKDQCYLPAAELCVDDDDRKYYASYSQRWHDYSTAFNSGLPLLRHFRFGAGPWWENGEIPSEKEGEITMGLFEDRYMVFCDGYGPSPYMETMIDYKDGKSSNGQRPTCDDQDREALEALLRKLGQEVNLADCKP